MADERIDVEGLRDFNTNGFSYDDLPTGSMETKKEEKPTVSEDETRGQEPPKRSWFGIFSLEYYQSFFDVTTNEVLCRIAAGMVPYPWNLASIVSSNPDLYGPFWICMTLVLTAALSGNISKFFNGSVKWNFHFHEVIVLSSCIYAYTICLPLCLWGLMVWRKVDGRYSLFQLLTIYGYSMAAFIPLTLLWLINIEALRWLLLFIALGLSGSVLTMSLWQTFRNETKNVSLIVMLFVVLLHAAIAIGFKFYYFRQIGYTESPTLGHTTLQTHAANTATNSTLIPLKTH